MSFNFSILWLKFFIADDFGDIIDLLISILFHLYCQCSLSRLESMYFFMVALYFIKWHHSLVCSDLCPH